MTNTTIPADRLVGSVYGLAFGDAVGDPVEFKRYAEIMNDGGARVPDLLRVTDDTQMSLAVWSAISHWDLPRTLGDRDRSMGWLRMELAIDFEEWRTDPDNNRAPGMTCMSSLKRLNRTGLAGWVAASDPRSAGCGAVMRAPWIGLSPKLSDEMVARVAMLQAVLTHAPAENAFVAAALADLTRALARDEVAPGGCAAWLLEWADERAGWSYDEAALGEVWRVARLSDDAKEGHSSPESYVAEGVEHVAWVAGVAGLLARELEIDPWGFDPCAFAGEGWRARETVALAVGILDAGFLGPDALLRAAETNGDSDSIGAVTGALIGAAYGNAFPVEWLDRVEDRYRRELAGVVRSGSS